MPITGGTRMLRARRKDCNVKPNRRLDRKSSRGMLYENEELRMRTITINAEVEQGQHALKKLRRENEQLRREMWSLRDEYDKMEKLLRKKEMDDESNQENSDSEGNITRTDDSEDEKSGPTEQQDEKEEQDDDENHLKSMPDTESNVRNFDGLSVIDEQTEETQTTDSPLGCATSSRGNSEVNPTLTPTIQMYDQACGLSQFSQYVPGYTASVKPSTKRKSPYENGHFPGGWPPTPVCDAYESRPASPYPYNGTLHRDSYRKRFQVLENLSPLATSATTVSETGWILPDSSKSTDLPEYEMFLESPYLTEKPADVAPELPPTDFPYDLIQDRTGPDVFVTDGYSQDKEEIQGTETNPNPNLMANLETKLDGVKIGHKTERDPKIAFEPRGEQAEGRRGTGERDNDDDEQNRITAQPTKSHVSRESAAVELAKIPWDPQQTPDTPKLTIDESPGENDNNRFPSHVRTLVSCQNPLGQHVRDRFAPGTESKSPRSEPPNQMPQTDKSGPSGPVGSSKYQTKLTVTLKTPTLSRPEGKKSFAPTNLGPPTRTFSNQSQNHALRYGLKPEYTTMRFQTFPSSTAGCQQQGPRTHATDGRDCLVNHYAGVRTHPNGLSGSLPRLPPAIPKQLQLGFKPSHIPTTSLDKQIDVLPDEESPASATAAPTYSKPLKIPPVPPPRTSSYPKHIIPGTSTQGCNFLQQRTYTQGKQVPGHAEPKPMDPIMYNPLLLSQPIATSSPTISLRMTKNGPNSSNENLYLSRFQRQNYYDESSNEDLTRQKSKFRNEITSTTVAPGRKLNKSLSSPSFDTFRTIRRKQTEPVFANSVENILSPTGVPSLEKPDKKQPAFKGHGQSNVSISSSSGLDSPVKTERRKRRVSIQFKKHQQQVQQETKRGDEDKESACTTRHNSLVQGGPSTSRTGPGGFKLKGKMEETDATTSERERTNSISSRTSSLATGSGSRRKFSTSSNRTYLNDEKIPWCGCWGNGCI